MPAKTVVKGLKPDAGQKSRVGQSHSTLSNYESDAGNKEEHSSEAGKRHAPSVTSVLTVAWPRATPLKSTLVCAFTTDNEIFTGPFSAWKRMRKC